MRINRADFSLHGLRVQVVLWTILPLTILLIIFSFTGISSHQNSMHALAAEENTRLVLALARAISVQVDNYRLRSSGSSTQAVPTSELELETLLNINHPNAIPTIILLNKEGMVLFSKGLAAIEQDILQWPSVKRAFAGESGVLFEPETGEGDVIAFAPVDNTDWALIIREPWHSLTVPLLRFEQAMPFVLFVGTLVSLLTLFFGLRFVVTPLRRLGLQASRIGQGDFDAAAKSVGGVQEIEDLRATLNQMAHRLEQYQAALQDYLRAITETQEEERARLARELHDETVQTLIALGHKAQMVQRTLERDPPQAVERVSELRQMVTSAIEEVRRLSRALRPSYLEELGLIPALEMLAREAGATFHVTGTPKRLKPEHELALYRIAQEALSNVRRHAKSSQIHVDFQVTDAEVKLRVQDNGLGFEVPASLNDLTRTGHFGLIGMRERAQLIGGQLDVVSAVNQGTTVTVTLPA
jgi:two-component system sensor histidine kinase UhpB